MLIIPLDKLVIPPDRHRRAFPPRLLAELSQSIEKVGLLHPIVVRTVLSTDPDTQYVLVAGERRVRAVQTLVAPYRSNDITLQPGTILATRFEDLDPLAQQEAEAHENMMRSDLSWQERDAALARIHDLHKARDPAHTLGATAREVNEQHGTALSANAISRAKFVQQHMDKPQVANARSSHEAFQIASKLAEAEFAAKLGQKLAEQRPCDHLFIPGDTGVQLPNLPSAYFDCIIADPPYGIGADSFGDAGPSHTYKDTPEAAIEVNELIITQGFRIAKPRAHLYLFCDVDLFGYWKELAVDAGWYVWRTPLIWYKGSNVGHAPRPGFGPRRTYEMLMYCIKGDKSCASTYSDTLTEFRNDANSGHAAAKPVGMYEYLLRMVCSPGDHIVDPCCGSGTVFAAANRLQLVATGIERDEQWFDTIRARMYSKE